MRTVKRIVTLTCCIAVCLCIAGRIKARAAAIPEGAEVLSDLLENVGIQNDLTGITKAYTSLTDDQKLLVAYLMGAWNNMYLCARGFQYNIPDDESSIKAEFIALGRRVLTFALTDYAWRSRTNEVFRQYMSSIIVYASQYDSFDDWYIDHKYGGSKTLYIPYSEDAFSAWTVWYNDPSGDGIASFGDTISEWASGEYYDFAFVGLPWNNSTSQNQYNNFILNYSPVLYTNTGNIVAGALTQFMLSLSSYPNTLFIQRGNNSQYQYYRFGFDDFTYPNVPYKYVRMGSDNVKVVVNDVVTNMSQQLSIVNYGSLTSLTNIIAYAFNKTPFTLQASATYTFHPTNWFPFIDHVYLVDELNSMSNPEEIYNVDSLNVVAPSNDSFIVTPNGKFLNPVWPTANGDPMNALDNIIDNSVDLEFNPVTDDDYSKKIVNNTTINNYYVSDSELINVPVEWFDNPYTQQLGEDALPFIGFARDCIDTLGDFDVYMYGAIVIGLGGGIVKKLLL